MSRFDDAIAAMDAAHAQDPNQITLDGKLLAAELRYAQRMSEMLMAVYPDASEELRLAARCQHIRRWELARADYPEGRAGYLQWRTEEKRRHAVVAADILRGAGYDDATAGRVGQLVRKERLKQDADAQRLEDVACLVFLEDHLADFAPKHSEAKVLDVIVKTWPKMSAAGQQAALKLKLPPVSQRLVQLALGNG
ncbi:MAG TPA: DUF4202 domain-containing protein [Alphaproteobacteria bacterium]|nr:DUF4202 domain-containing protein [Alphaproteobacteria bacterium]